MKITPEMVFEWLRYKKLLIRYPVCSNKSFGLADVVTCPIVDYDNSLYKDSGHPIIQLYCDNCYFVMQFMAKPIFDFFKNELLNST